MNVSTKDIVLHRGDTSLAMTTPVLEGFELTMPPEFPRLIASIWGADKTGKTSLGLTFPEPRVYLNLDHGLRELMLARPELVGSCQHIDIPMDERCDSETWQRILYTFYDAYVRALAFAEEHQGTVIVDTATQLWAVVSGLKVDQVRQRRIQEAANRSYSKDSAREEAMARAEKSNRFDWGEANSFMGGLIRRAAHTERASALFINRAREEFDGVGKPTGALVYHGFSEMSAITQVHIQTIKRGGNYFAKIDRCRYNGTIEGMEIMDPTFDVLHAFITP